MVFGFVAARARGVFGETFGVGAGVIATATACKSANAASLNSGVAWLICGVGGAVALIWASQHPDRHERSRFTQTAATEISASTAAPTLSPSVAGDGSALDIELFTTREFFRSVLQSTMDYADYEGGLSLGGLSLGGRSHKRRVAHHKGGLSLGGFNLAGTKFGTHKQRKGESYGDYLLRLRSFIIDPLAGEAHDHYQERVMEILEAGKKPRKPMSAAQKAASIQRLAAARELQGLARYQFQQEHGRLPSRAEQKHAYAQVKASMGLAAEPEPLIDDSFLDELYAEAQQRSHAHELAAAGGFSWGDFKKLASSAANTAASTAMRLAAENPELVQMGLSHAKSMAKKKLGFGGRLTNQQLIGLARRF